ncbi:NAD(P)-binding protein [Mycena haematopus]|nr:NAD(P)-binding protein [Mycena haematopus]
MSHTKTNFFLTGATGYIGGSVLTRFLAHSRADTFHFTVLVRDPKKAEKFKELGVNVKAVVGSHSDAALVERLASEADVVVAAADADDLGAAKATLAGLKKRHAASGVVPIFIHTAPAFCKSGTGVIVEDAKGLSPGSTIYDDSDADQIASLHPTRPHREVDLAITAADAEGYVKTYIILPSTIYGLASTRLVALGVQNPHSVQIPKLISVALARGQAGMVGEGKNLWPNVEIHEVAELYTTLYDNIVADPSETGHGRNGFYFGASGEHSLYDIGKAIGEALVKLGKSGSAEPTAFTQAEFDQYPGLVYFGASSRCRATHSLSLGWKPVKTTKDMLASIFPEVEAIIRKETGEVV